LLITTARAPVSRDAVSVDGSVTRLDRQPLRAEQRRQRIVG